MSDESALAGIFNLLPEEYASDQVRARLDKLSRYLDGMLFLDHTAELAVDRSAFLELCRDEELVPAEIRDIFILETAKHCGRRLKEFESKGRRIRWREGEKYGLLGHSAVDELCEQGYTPSVSPNELEASLLEWYPELETSKEAMRRFSEPGAYEWFIKRLQENRTFWDCLVANLGWFTAINVIGTSTVLFIMLANGVPGPAIIAALVAYTGLLQAYTLLNCAQNPYWQF